MKFKKIKRSIITSILICAVVSLFPTKAFAGSCGNEDSYFPKVEAALNNYPSTDFSKSAFEQYMSSEANRICSSSSFKVTKIEIGNIDESSKRTNITYKITAKCSNHGIRTLTRTFSVTLPEASPGVPTVNITRSGNNAVVTVVPDINNFKSVKIYRDNSLVYEGTNTTYTQAINITPAKPSLKESTTLSNSCKFKVNTVSTSQKLTYKAQVVSHYGSYTSGFTTKTMDVSSVVKGYAVKVDKNANTDPGTTITSTDGYTNVSGYKRGDVVYVHARAINTFGVSSDVLHYKYVVGQTENDLKSDINNYVNKLGNNNNAVNTVDSSAILKLRTNANIPFTYTNASNINATKYNNGNVIVKTKVNNKDYSSTKVITARPEYQTKEEYKSDIDNYVNAGNIDRDVTYSDFITMKKKIKRELEDNCKDNQSLGDIEIELSSDSTEFSSKQIDVKVYYNG